MKISVDIRCLQKQPLTGVGVYTKNLLDAIFEIDKINEYFLFTNSAQEIKINEWHQPNVHLIKTRYPNKLLNFLLQTKIIKLDKLTNQNLDYWFSPNLNFTNLSKKINHILTIHDLSFEFYPEFYTFKQRWWHKILNPKKQCQKTHLILCPSQHTAQDVANLYQIDENKIKVIYPGITKPILKNNPPHNLSAKYVLFLGTIEPRKNILGLVEAWEKISPLLPTPYTLIIAGATGWKNNKIEKIINAHQNNITLVKDIAEEEKYELLNNASLFVFPSFYEGFGFPILEAMNLGVPVITSNRSSLPEIALNSAYLINPNKPTEIALAIKKIITDEELKNRLITAGYKTPEKYNWQNSAKQFLELLK